MLWILSPITILVTQHTDQRFLDMVESFDAPTHPERIRTALYIPTPHPTNQAIHTSHQTPRQPPDRKQHPPSMQFRCMTQQQADPDASSAKKKK